VIIIAVDPGDPDVMHRPPRDPKVPISNRTAIVFWLLYAAVLFIGALIPLFAGPDEPSTTVPTASVTMTFAVMGIGTVFNALSNRRDPGSGFAAPVLKAMAIGLIPVGMVVLATRVDFLQQSMLTKPLTGPQWLACIALALPLALVVEISKWIRRRRTSQPTIDARQAVAPAHARNERIGVAVK